MMIIVGGTVEFATDDQEKLLDLIRQMMADSQAEDGCLAYEFSLDLSKPNILHLYEEWETAEALKTHNESKHMAAFKEAAFPSFTGTDISRYNAELAG
jgi:quinol monooxygenase YgiN